MKSDKPTGRRFALKEITLSRSKRASLYFRKVKSALGDLLEAIKTPPEKTVHEWVAVLPGDHGYETAPMEEFEHPLPFSIPIAQS